MTTETPASQPPSAGSSSSGHPEHHYQHDPEQTALERVLNSGLEKVEPYSNQILIAIIAVTVIAVGAIMWVRGSHATHSTGWKEFVAARVPDDFAKVADSYPNTNLSAWARLQQARGHLQDGLQEATKNRVVSDEHLADAQKAYEDLLKSGSNVPAAVREEALYGMATTLEALSDGNVEPAVKAYEELISAFPQTRHLKWAQHRIEVLKSPATQEFYAWFRKQKPSPADRPLPKDFDTSGSNFTLPLGLPGEIPSTTPPPSSGGATTPLDSSIPPITLPGLPGSAAPASPPAPAPATTPEGTTPPVSPAAPQTEATPPTTPSAPPAAESPPATPPATETPQAAPPAP